MTIVVEPAPNNSYSFGYIFWCNGRIVARCDESDYHETVARLCEDGYSFR